MWSALEGYVTTLVLHFVMGKFWKRSNSRRAMFLSVVYFYTWGSS